jgi:hypothetical protein
MWKEEWCLGSRATGEPERSTYEKKMEGVRCSTHPSKCGISVNWKWHRNICVHILLGRFFITSSPQIRKCYCWVFNQDRAKWTHRALAGAPMGSPKPPNPKRTEGQNSEMRPEERKSSKEEGNNNTPPTSLVPDPTNKEGVKGFGFRYAEELCWISGRKGLPRCPTTDDRRSSGVYNSPRGIKQHPTPCQP